jgi:tetratricopeptide (TPR) repeat protein
MPQPDDEKLRVIQDRTLSSEDVVAQLKARERSQRKWMLVLAAVPIVVGVGLLIYIYWIRNVPELPMNARLTVQAWNAFNAGKWDEAIAHTDKCIAQYAEAAAAAQAELLMSAVALPPVGPVPSDVRLRVSNRGPLNDVATCYYIRGRAAENLGRAELAAAAYKEALRFPHARCWDPNGWFWSPAIAAQERLNGRKKP